MLVPALLAGGWRATAETVFHDDFEGSLKPDWSIVRPDASYYTVQSTGLVLRCNSGDIWGPRTDALNLFLVSNPAPADFTVTARLRWSIPPIADYGQFDLLAYDDDDNYVRLSHGMLSGTLRVDNAGESGGAYSGHGLTDVNFDTDWFWLQMRKSGSTYSAWYSRDGMVFAEASSAFIYGDGTPANLGFVAMVDPNQSAQVVVDEFTVENTPEPTPRFTVDWWTIDGGGGTPTNAQFTLSGTIGQPDAAAMGSGNYTVQGGFWGVIAAVQTPGAPRLSIARSVTMVIVSWPLPAEGWVLEWTEDVPAISAPWLQLAPPYETNGANLQFSEPLPTGNRFYRLQRP